MTIAAPPQRRTANRRTLMPAGGNVIKKLPPAAPGAKRLTEHFGDALVCVRYREEAETGKRLTTVELIVAERPLPARTGVRIAYGETELRRRVKAAGGIWDAEHKVWRLPKAVIRKLKLEQRVVTEKA